MVNDKRGYDVAVYAVMLALIFVAMMLDRVISLALPVSMALLTLLVTFTCCFWRNSWQSGVLACVFFGVASMIKGAIFPEPIPLSINPLVSVLPRALMGFATFGVYRLMLRCFKNRKSYKNQVLCLTVAIFVGLAVNTVLFLSAANLYKMVLGEQYTGVFATIYLVLFTNIIPEYAVSMLFAPHLILAVRKATHIGIEGNGLESKKVTQE